VAPVGTRAFVYILAINAGPFVTGFAGTLERTGLIGAFSIRVAIVFAQGAFIDVGAINPATLKSGLTVTFKTPDLIHAICVGVTVIGIRGAFIYIHAAPLHIFVTSHPPGVFRAARVSAVTDFLLVTRIYPGTTKMPLGFKGFFRALGMRARTALGHIAETFRRTTNRLGVRDRI